MSDTIRVKYWEYVASSGDGSCSVYQFRTQELAEKYAENDRERFCDDISEVSFLINLDGTLVTDPSVEIVYDPTYGDDKICNDCKKTYTEHFKDSILVKNEECYGWCHY